MARRRRYEDDDDDYEYDDRPPRRRRQSGSGIGAAIGLGALAGLVGGEGVLILAGMDFVKNWGPWGVLFAWGLCFLVFALAPVFVLLGITGGVAAARTRSTLIGMLIGAASGPFLVFVLWACGAISIQVNNQPVKFNLNMALWASALLWIPGFVGALFVGLLTLGETNTEPAPERRRRRYEDDEEDEEDDRDHRRRRR